MEAIAFGLIGGGWRAEFFLRIAKALPERFAVKAVLVRDRGKADKLQEQWGVKTYTSFGEFAVACRNGCSFAVVSVKRLANPEFIERLAEAGIPALVETPPADGVEGLLRLWERVGPAAKVQIAEQYAFQPMHAARIRLARSGRLGEVSQAQVSAAHDYHGISLIRRLLGIGFENAVIRAQTFTSPIVKSPDRSGPPLSEELTESQQIIATLDFGNKLGVLDFTGDQYFSWIRDKRILVRGERGEIVNDEVSWLPSFDRPLYDRLRRIDTGHGGNLEGFHLQGIMGCGEWLYENPHAPARLSDDEIAVAETLARMGDYVRGGPSFYSLAEGCQDHYLALEMQRAAADGVPIVTETQPWAKALSRGNG
ncbi:Gfo/Idh/MocA family protein [Paenibacillus sabinae]|uniref:Oxidoreductase n=1 Tax=Paenibacillus sabinae T27 TaxID=1268072 RepID=X4ZGN7_9BACL|nr:Gfo/Idh/MocA family oxidoreductase [Paenibacillus sabinae]AHV95875.1 oxidoreductase [Paenibacillus sabinae T27]